MKRIRIEKKNIDEGVKKGGRNTPPTKKPPHTPQPSKPKPPSQDQK